MKRKQRIRSKHIQYGILIMLFVVFTLMFRIPNTTHQVGVDTFTFHAIADNIKEDGYLNNYHPLSLTGMYPLSLASSEVYFIAQLSLFTGLSTEHTILLLSFILSIVAGLGMYVLASRMNKGIFPLLASFFLTSSVYFTIFTQYSTTNRILFVVFVPLLLVQINDVVREKALRTKLWKGAGALLSLIFLAITHRMFQLILLIMLAVLLSLVYTYWSSILSYLKGFTWFENIVKYYADTKKLILHLGILIFIIAILKSVDLLLRDRFLPNLERFLIGPLEGLRYVVMQHNIILITLILALILSFALVSIVMILITKKNTKLGKQLQGLFTRTKKLLITHKEKIIPLLLLLLSLLLFVSQFIIPITDLEVDEFDESKFIEGDAPYILAVNLLINYSTGVNIFFIFSFVGLTLLLFKKEKSFIENVIMFTFIMLLPLLVNKRYVRAFSLPFISISLAIFFQWLFIKIKKKSKILMQICIVLVLTLSILGSITFVHRDYFLNEFQRTNDMKDVRLVGDWLAEQEEGTIVANDEVLEIRVGAYSGQHDMDHKIPDVLEEKDISIRTYTGSEFWEMMKQGKSKELGEVEDWMFPGQYYYPGRHRYYVATRELSEIDDFIETYDVHYLIEDTEIINYQEPLVASARKEQNKLYDSQRLWVWSAQEGRE